MDKLIISEYEDVKKLLSDKEEAYIQVCGKYTTIISEMFERLDIVDPDEHQLERIMRYQEGLAALFTHHFKKQRN